MTSTRRATLPSCQRRHLTSRTSAALGTGNPPVHPAYHQPTGSRPRTRRVYPFECTMTKPGDSVARDAHKDHQRDREGESDKPGTGNHHKTEKRNERETHRK